MEDLVPLITILSIFVVLPGMWMWFADRRRRDRLASGTATPTPANADLLRLAERMEKRIEALEKLLDAESPGWRKRHADE